jgi:hypothetical protein
MGIKRIMESSVFLFTQYNRCFSSHLIIDTSHRILVVQLLACVESEVCTSITIFRLAFDSNIT